MGRITSHYCLILLGIIFPLSHISKFEIRNHEWTMKSKNNRKNEIASLEISNEKGYLEAANRTADHLKSWKGQNSSPSGRHHWIANAHGIFNMIGWGGLLPVGVIIARNFRKDPLRNLHIVFQTSGYIIGAIGWGFGLWLGTNTHPSLITHRNLGIIIFTFATLQIVAAVWLEGKREDDERRRWWAICHKIMGYALLVIIIANTFEGIQNQHKWKWIYVGLLVFIGSFALFLEIFSCLMKRAIRRQIMAFDVNTYTTPT